jgi:hypothetical protein
MVNDSTKNINKTKINISPQINKHKKITDSKIFVIIEKACTEHVCHHFYIVSQLHDHSCIQYFEYMTRGLWCLMPLSTIFQLYRGRSVLLGETRVLGENQRLVASHR